MKLETVNLRGKKEVVMTAYLLDITNEFSNIDKRPAVLIFPGGGYYYTSDREAEPIAMSYLAEGYNAFVLRYSVGKDSDFSEALKDADAAMELIRKNSEKWSTDKEKIAVIGFSAGGHLAAALGTMGKERPNAMILGYPCILANFGDVLAFPVPSLDKEVDKLTPPAFLFSTFEDSLVPIENTIQFMQALNQYHIPFESHIFQKGHHGLTLAKPLTSNGVKSAVNPDFAKWLELSVAWLHNVLGDFSADQVPPHIPNAKEVNEYSIDVTLNSLLNHRDCQNILFEYIPAKYKQKLMGDDQKGIGELSIAVINKYLPEPLSETKLSELNNRLRAIPYLDEQ